jgi:hypothetical protein
LQEEAPVAIPTEISWQEEAEPVDSFMPRLNLYQVLKRSSSAMVEQDKQP